MAAELFRRLYHALPTPPSTNYHLGSMRVDPYDLVPPNASVLDIGAGAAKGHYAFVRRPLQTRAIRIISLDFEAGDGVNVCADAHRLPLSSGSVDGVTCVSTLEYVRSPEQVISEISRVLRPGGMLYLSAPFVFPHHPPPDDRFRFSPSGLRALAAGFDEVDAGSNRGPASTFCHLFVHFSAVALCFNSRTAYGILLDFFKWVFFWIKYLDRWIGRFDVAHVMHGNAFFVGRKRHDG